MTDKELNQARSLVYQLLSSLFAWEVSEQRQRELTSDDAMAFWHSLAQDEALAPQVQILQSTLMHMINERQRLELAADFCGLFLVGDKQSASPYASLYLSDEEMPTLFGEQHHVMCDFLRQSGLQLQSDFKEPADHLAVMLAFMGQLCLHADRGSQLSFLETCIDSWLGRFVDKVDTCDPGQFYRALAKLTLLWVRDDISALAN
ncbi:molecular chaperone TorD [Shewanella sp. GXUN23E]|uniref:molecular chaperone TorD n=1 Tax=Shewanella sp. GXUN23E TaxID=3422498 RepID=UPI003D7EA702